MNTTPQTQPQIIGEPTPIRYRLWRDGEWQKVTREEWLAYDAEAAYEEELVKRHEEGRDYPLGDKLDCYTCGEPRTCVALGPVVDKADPTQSYRLDCGHVVI